MYVILYVSDIFINVHSVSDIHESNIKVMTLFNLNIPEEDRNQHQDHINERQGKKEK